MKLDIYNNKEHAYLIGFIQTDGSIYDNTRNRGKITIELSKKDINILQKLSLLFDCNISLTERKRNIKIKHYEYIDNETSTLSIFDLDTRNQIKQYVPSSKKSDIISKPDNIIEIDYWRGIIDGDGSIGFMKNGFPFISLVTKSDALAKDYILFISNIIGYQKECNKNKRDNAYNIMTTNEDAQKIIKFLYYENCLSIDRKYNMAQDIFKWIRPDNVKKIDFKRKKWTNEEDNFILSHEIEESMDYLNRTEKSIKMRLYRLKNII